MVLFNQISYFLFHLMKPLEPSAYCFTVWEFISYFNSNLLIYGFCKYIGSKKKPMENGGPLCGNYKEFCFVSSALDDKTQVVDSTQAQRRWLIQ